MIKCEVVKWKPKDKYYMVYLIQYSGKKRLFETVMLYVVHDVNIILQQNRLKKLF